MRTLSGDRAPHLAQRGRTALNTHRTMIPIGLEGGRQWSDISPGGEMVQRCNRRTSSCGAGGKYLTRDSVVAVARVTGARVIRRECRTLLSTRPSLIPLVQTLAHPLISQQDLCRVHTIEPNHPVIMVAPHGADCATVIQFQNHLSLFHRFTFFIHFPAGLTSILRNITSLNNLRIVFVFVLSCFLN